MRSPDADRSDDPPLDAKPDKVLSIPASDQQRWVVAEGDLRDGPVIVRVNSSAQAFVGHMGLPIKLGFAVPLKRPNPKGLPDPAENEAFHTVEDIIIERVIAEATGLHVMTPG